MFFPRVKELREDGNQTQSNIAKLLQITETQYSKYENDLRAFRTSHLILLADFYEVSVDYIVGITDDKTPYPK